MTIIQGPMRDVWRNSRDFREMFLGLLAILVVLLALCVVAYRFHEMEREHKAQIAAMSKPVVMWCEQASDTVTACRELREGLTANGATLPNGKRDK